METRHKVLLVDDEPDDLELYREFLESLPSKPEIRTANSGSRGLTMLDDDSYRLLVCDLRMPKMDGLQVLSVVRRKHPQVRTVALTAVQDEQFRSRAYALGVDQFWHKPGTEQERELFLDCIESLLGRDEEIGFRGIQSKSLLDIIQLECMSQSSSVLRISNGPLSGKIWIQNGELIDAEAGEFKGEAALQRIFAWRAGAFETLPADPARERIIFKSYNALLLETAQVVDELRDQPVAESSEHSLTRQLAQIEGMEFILALRNGQADPELARGLESPERMSAWARQMLGEFGRLGELLHAGPIQHIQASGPQRQVSLAQQGEVKLCVGWQHSLTPEEIGEKARKVAALWVS